MAFIYDESDKPKVGDIIINKNPTEGESPWMLIAKDAYGDFRCAQGPGKYSKKRWEFEYCQQMTVDQITESYKKIGFISFN